MTKLNANSDNTPSTPPKRGGWRRFFLWAALAGGVVFVLLLVILIALTVPNLRREVAPPEVSGGHRVSRTVPEHTITASPASPESANSPSDVPAGAPSLFNLDDFPHLSPHMRTLSLAWLDQCEETSRTLDGITDPKVHARMLQFLRIRKDKMRAFLNSPLEWEDQAFKDAESRIWRARAIYGMIDPFPELADTIRKETIRFNVLSERMTFEFYASQEMWDLAADFCGRADRQAFHHSEFLGSFQKVKRPPEDPEFLAGYREMNTWDEEVYCLRQTGGRGLVALTARSYQQAVGARMKGQENSTLFQVVRLGTAPLLIPTVLKPASQKRSQARNQTPGTDTIPEDGGE